MSTFQASYNNESVVRALAKYKEWVDKGWFPQGFLTQDPNDTRIALYAGRAAMDLQGPWFDGMIIQDGQDINLYGTFPFPSGSNRFSAFAEMIQLNANMSREKLEECIKYLNWLYSKESIARYSSYFNQPLPRLDAEMPRNLPNVPVKYANANRYGTFTITDQAFPTEVADELFRVQDGVANSQITPQQGAARIQTAIEAYLRNR
jgi:raffinose/stachyose/melibiose transport system substrate-binding protein